MLEKRTNAILIFAMAAVMAASGIEYKRERYNVIVDRSPFGEDPALAEDAKKIAQEAAQAAEAAKLAQQMEKKIRLCYLMETQSGEIRAGFENKGAKEGDPKSIMLMLNESVMGMKLTKIDLANSSATLEMGGKPVTFTLTKAAPAPAAAKPAAAPQRRFGGGFRRQPEPAKPPEPQLSPEEQAAKREEVRENLRQYQMEVIRAGMPPLPIPLTQDMDDQLVAEGVLPPGAAPE